METDTSSTLAQSQAAPSLGLGEPMSTGDGPAARISSGEIKKWVAVAVAALVLLIYICLVYRAWNASGNEAEMWARKVGLLGGVESLAFAAAGWFFGREVNRQAVDNLQTQADKASDEASSVRDAEKQTLERLDSARSEAAALAASILASADRPAGGPSDLREEAPRATEIVRRARHVLNIYGEGSVSE